MLVKDFIKEDEQLFCKLCKEFYSSGSTIREYNEEIAKKTFERVLDHHENLFGYFIIRRDSEEVIGYALVTSYWCNEEGGTVLILDEFYICPDDRHKGYASAFMEWLQEEYKDKAVSMTLEVLTSNLNAQNLYKKEGFIPDGFLTMTKEIKR
ncbi:MAG: GNAT family N-acetyltransferase [Clostridia bacterium]|nr:GNAT family N-acetyltransferase [Clostridia bacterium]